MKKLGLALFALLLALPAQAQSVQQSGSIVPGQIPYFVTNGVIANGGNAADSPITSIGITNNSSAGFCVSSGRVTAAGRQQLCFGAPLGSNAVISLQNYGTATAQSLSFVINGATIVLPTGSQTFITGTGTFVAGNLVKFFNSAGVVQDAGVALSTGTQFGLPVYSTTSAIGSTGAGTNGQVLVGQTAAIPLWQTLSGDVSSITAGGVVTLGKVNGVTFSPTYTAHGVLLGEGTSAFNSTTTVNVGYCLLSQGTSSDPIWAACASGAGSAGGSNTQVQFNSSTTLAGSPNFTWVNPALTIGLAGTTTGQLALASSTATGTVTLQAPGVAGTYNFNYPTGAGSTGQPLISGGGGSTPNTFGTLGIFGGGTNCAAASGTCLDNITGFASTGYVNRTGAGTYAFSTVIPVSGGGTNLASGTSGGILGYTATGTLASSALLAANGFVIGGGAGATPTALAACTNGQIPVGVTSSPPVCQSLSGDISAVTSGGSVTIANSAITVAKQANAAGYTLEGNFTASSAAPQFSTIGGLTQKASPGANDILLLQDQAAAGQLKYATVSSIASAGSVASLNTLTGALTLLTEPQGRLTLTANTPVMIATASAQTTLRYDCYIGNQVPYYIGSADAVDTISSCEATDAMISAASAGQVVSGQVYDLWWVHSGAARICLAMSAASGGGGGWASDTGGSATARGTGYTQLDRTTRPYITNKNAITNCFNGSSNYGSVGANQGTYLGTVLASANGQISWTLGASASGGTAAQLGVWNMYNRVSIGTTVTDSGTSYTYTTATTRQARASAGNQIQFVYGVAEDSAQFLYSSEQSIVSALVANTIICIGFDTTSACSSNRYIVENPAALTALVVTSAPNYTAVFPIGLHTASANERGDGSNANTFDNNGGNAFTGNLRM